MQIALVDCVIWSPELRQINKKILCLKVRPGIA